jgi:hypothetical protein
MQYAIVLGLGTFLVLGLFAFSYGVSIPKVKAMEIRARVRIHETEVERMREYLTVDYLRLRWLEMTDEEKELYMDLWGPPAWAHPTNSPDLVEGRSMRG